VNPNYTKQTENVLITPEMIVEAIYSAIESQGPRWPELETQALELAAVHPEVMEACVAYAREIIKGRWEELEPVILQAFVSNPVAGRVCVDDYYEPDVIGDYIWAYFEVINGRWLEWEQEMVGLAAKNIDLLYTCVRYAKERIKDRWLEVEPLLLRALLGDNRTWLWAGSGWMIFEYWLIYNYMSDVVAGPWPELEAVILDHWWLLTFGVAYAICGRRSRWPALEERMLGFGDGPMSRSEISDIVSYAAELFEGRPWPEAERFFKEDLRQRSPNAAAIAASSYAEHVIRGRWQAGEELLSGFAFEMSWYARYALKGPLPEHLYVEMMMRSFETPVDCHVKDYFKWLDEWTAAARGEAP
jgi:hypothetical protein